MLQRSVECCKMMDLDWIFKQIFFQIKTQVSAITWILKDVSHHTSHVIWPLHNCLLNIGSRSHWNWAGHKILWWTANLWNMAITHLSVKAVEACKRWKQNVLTSWMMQNIFLIQVLFCKCLFFFLSLSLFGFWIWFEGILAFCKARYSLCFRRTCFWRSRKPLTHQFYFAASKRDF